MHRLIARSLASTIVAVIIVISFSDVFALTLTNHTGWPMALSSSNVKSPNLGNMDFDSNLEIIVAKIPAGQYGTLKIFVWDEDNSTLWSPASYTGGGAHPVLADLDNNSADGLEMVFTVAKKLYAYYSNGTQLWVYTAGNKWEESLSAGDIDNDGGIEVVAGNSDGNTYVIRDGAIVTSYVTGSVYFAPAFGDLNGDGLLEIVVGSKNGRVYALKSDGTTYWTYSTGSIDYSAPALGDIDNDGSLEVVVETTAGVVYALHSNGTPKWSNNVGGSGFSASPALGDLDGDGRLEVVVASSNKVHVLDDDGSILSSRNFGCLVRSSPALADLYNDNSPEIVLTVPSGACSSTSKLYVLDTNTADIITPVPLEGTIWYSSPAIADIDGDGLAEITVATRGTNGEVYVFDTDAAYSDSTAPWPMFHRDPGHTGMHSPVARIDSPSNGSSFNQAENFTFNGSGLSIDGALSYDWYADNNPIGSGAVLSGAYLLTPGVHTIWLTVTDQTGRSDDSAPITVAITNLPPVVSITYPSDGASFEKGAVISFNSSASDPDGVIASYIWSSDLLSDPLSTLPSFQTDILPPGRHRINLTVTDSDGAVASDNIAVLVQVQNYSATWISKNKTFIPGSILPVRFTVKDLDSDTPFYDNTLQADLLDENNLSVQRFHSTDMSWNGSEYTIKTTSSTALTPGDYTLRITSDVAPQGTVLETPLFTSVFYSGKNITFDASQLFGVGSLAQYQWNFGDGNTGTGRTVQHSYSSQGTYSVIFTGTYANSSAYNGDLKVKVNKAGDVNGDFTVDILDLTTIGLYWNKVETDPDFDPRIDITGDGKIDISDASEVAFNWT